MAGWPNRADACNKSASRSKPPSMLGQGQFSIYLPRRVDADYYVRSPVKVKAEMLLSPDHLGGRASGPIACRARAEKLTHENGLSVVNVPIKIEAEILLTPGMAFSYKTSTPTVSPQDSNDGTSSFSDAKSSENWESWEKKMRDVLRKYRGAGGVRAGGFQAKHVMVQEVRLDDNCARTKELSRRINSYADQVFAQNKKIRVLQDRLREEESSRAESSEKVYVAEQHCKVLERRLKAAQGRAKGAEHQAEVIKHRTKDLGVVCGHQGVQLKELAKEVDYFAKRLAIQRESALDTYKALKQRMLGQSGARPEEVNARGPDPGTACESFDSIVTAKPASFKLEIGAEGVPPSDHRSYGTANLPEPDCENVFSPVKSRRLQVELQQLPRPEHRVPSEYTDFESSSMQAGLLLNQLLQVAPNWLVEFNSSIQRAEELIQHCGVQALRLRNLSLDLDEFGLKNRNEVRCLRLSTFVEMGKIDRSEFQRQPCEEVGVPCCKPTNRRELRCSRVAKLAEVERLEAQPRLCEDEGISGCKYIDSVRKERSFNSRGAAETAAESVIKVGLGNKRIQRSEEGVKDCKAGLTDSFIKKSRNLAVVAPSTHGGQMSRQTRLRRATMPFRYEVRAWKMAVRALIQALLLCFGLLLLPDLHFRNMIPPAT